MIRTGNSQNNSEQVSLITVKTVQVLRITVTTLNSGDYAAAVKQYR